MRGAYSVMAVLALGAALTMYQASGAAAALGDGRQFQSDNALADAEQNVSAEAGVNGSVSQSEGSIVGLIVGGGELIFQFLGNVVLLPLELINLGFPAWFAGPIGLILQIHAGIAGVQFATNHRLN